MTYPTAPIQNPTRDQMLGIPKVEKVSIDVRQWRALRRQMVRMVLGWRIADREMALVLAGCRHDAGCPAREDRTQSCLSTCPDRETRLSALVVKHNAELYSMHGETLPKHGDDYRPPPREYFDAIVSELEALREGKDILSEIAEARAKNVQASPFAEEGGSKEQPLTRLVPVGEEQRGPEEEAAEEDLDIDEDGDEDDENGDG